jgi:hypothetical protein
MAGSLHGVGVARRLRQIDRAIGQRRVDRLEVASLSWAVAFRAMMMMMMMMMMRSTNSHSDDSASSQVWITSSNPWGRFGAKHNLPFASEPRRTAIASPPPNVAESR